MNQWCSLELALEQDYFHEIVTPYNNERIGLTKLIADF